MGIESFGPRWLTHNWLQKLIAVLAALVIWILVHQAITTTKTIPNVPVRIINIPAEKTIVGILPNGLFSKRVTLTLTGTQDVVDLLEPGDFEVLLDASHKPDEWVVQITKKNLVSLNPDIDLAEHITSVTHTDLILKFSRVVTAQIPVVILPPKDNPPKGYQFLDIWPSKLIQTVVGPEEEVEKLQSTGIELEFDLDKISSDQLELLASNAMAGADDEVAFPVPQSWKQVMLPFLTNMPQALNDPYAEYLRINFLKETLIPLNQNLPILTFYPLESSTEINPAIAGLAINGLVQKKDSIPYLAKTLFVSGASRRFVEIVHSQLSITINARPRTPGERLSWNLQLVNPRALEDLFVSLLFGEQENVKVGKLYEKQREQFLRTRFREYLQNLRLYTGKDRKLNLDCRLINNQIQVNTDQPTIAERSLNRE